MYKHILSFFIILSNIFYILGKDNVPVLKVGYAGHDHQTALYIACLESQRTQREIDIYMKEINPKKHYELYKGKNKIANIEIFLSGGGSKIPTNMAQGTFEVGFGGVAAFAFFIDKGTPMKIISPLHSKGDMLVVKPDNPADSWESFIQYVQKEKRPVKIGFKSPVAVAKLIFERGLQEEGISFTGDASDKNKEVIMINMKEAGNLVPGLQNNLIDGFVCNNPVCAVAQHKGVGKSIADLNTLPPGIWKDHPCCAIAVTEKALQEKRDVLVPFMQLIILATNYINEDIAIAVKDASQWLGVAEAVEKESIPTSGYSTIPSQKWKKGMYVWVDAMHELDRFKGDLADKRNSDVDPLLFDFSVLDEAAAQLQKQKITTQY